MIDADHAALRQAERLLAREGFQTALADDAETGLRLARTLRPAVILLDLLPATNGREILRQLEADAAACACPVLLLGGAGLENFGQGAADRLGKPLLAEELRDALARVKPPQSAGLAAGEPDGARAAHA